jgi:hypothetical protein
MMKFLIGVIFLVLALIVAQIHISLFVYFIAAVAAWALLYHLEKR